jgi:mRNA interferase HicA
MNAKEILKILMQNGFQKIRQTGSHIRLKKNDRNTTVAIHGKKDIAIGTIKQIEKDSGVKLL